MKFDMHIPVWQCPNPPGGAAGEVCHLWLPCFICNCNRINCGLSTFSLGLIPSLRFVERVIEVCHLWLPCFICNSNRISCGLSTFSLGLIPSLRFVERVIEVIVLLNKPLNCTSVSLPLFPRELDTLHFGARYQDWARRIQRGNMEWRKFFYDTKKNGTTRDWLSEDDWRRGQYVGDTLGRRRYYNTLSRKERSTEG